jgi:6-phosphogluconolactonase
MCRRRASICVPTGGSSTRQNRGDNSLAIFGVDEASGRLPWLGTVNSGGREPRKTGIEPSGTDLFECNQQPGDVATFVIDASTGRLTAGPKVELPQPGVISSALI